MQKTVKTLTQTPGSLLLLTAGILVLLYKYAGDTFGIVVLLPKQAASSIALGLVVAAFGLMKRRTFLTPIADKAFAVRFMSIECLRYVWLSLIMTAFGIIMFAHQPHIFDVEIKTVIRASTVVVIVGFMAAFIIGMMRTRLLKKYAQALPKT